MASREHRPCVITMHWIQQTGINYPFILRLKAEHLVLVVTMEERQTDGNHPRFLLPLRCECPPGAAIPSCRTITGRRCSVWACLETLPGVHFTNSSCCGASDSFDISRATFTGIPSSSILNLNSQALRHRYFCTSGHLHRQSNPGSSSALTPSPESLSGKPSISHSLFAMPRLRQRMRPRRGTSRGRSSGLPPLPHSDISSSSDGGDNTPPRSSRDGRRRNRGRGCLVGRGRGRAQVTQAASDIPVAHPAPPGFSPPTTCPIPSCQPLPSDDITHPGQPSPSSFRARGTSIRQTTQNAELRFHCTSYDSIITALITVSLREEIPLSAHPPAPDPCPNPSPHADISTEVQRQNMHSDSQEGQEDSSTGNEYACRVEEEPPSSEDKS